MTTVTIDEVAAARARRLGALAPTGEFRKCTDSGNAERLIDRHGANLRYVDGVGWHTWTGQRWERDATGAVQRLAKETVRSIYSEAARCENAEVRKAVGDHARKSESRDKRAAMVDLARHEDGITITSDRLDTNGMLYNVANGTIDLRTGQLFAHQRDDLCSKLSPIAYADSAVAPTWDAFLSRVLPDREVRAFIQRFIGYSLTASVIEQVLVFCHGDGDNGKSTFVAILQALLGSYAKQGAPDLLLAKKNDTHPCDQADLLGARLVVCNEIEAGRAWAEVTVKQLTGGDRIKARLMRENFFEFNATHKLIVCANHKPTVRGTDHAIWRRMRLVPFTQRITAEEKDPRLLEKLRAELPGILRWAVEGCLAWQRDGLGCPSEVSAATKGYRGEMDLVGRFIDDRCTVAPQLSDTATRLYRAFVLWLEEEGERAQISQRRFADALSERGFKAVRTKVARSWTGLTVGDASRLVTLQRGVLPMNDSYLGSRDLIPEVTSPSVIASPGAALS